MGIAVPIEAHEPAPGTLNVLQHPLRGHPPNWSQLQVRAYADSEASFSAASFLLIRRRAAIAGMLEALGRVMASSHLYTD